MTTLVGLHEWHRSCSSRHDFRQGNRRPGRDTFQIVQYAYGMAEIRTWSATSFLLSPSGVGEAGGLASSTVRGFVGPQGQRLGISWLLLGAKAGVSCASLRSDSWCFFFGSSSSSVLTCLYLRSHERSHVLFTSCGLLSRSVRKCCLGCSEPLSWGFHWFRVHVLVGALGSYCVARVTRFRVGLWWKLLAAFPCFSSRSTPHVRNACVLGAVLWEPHLAANARLLAFSSQGSGSFVERALLCAVWQHRP